MALPVMTAASLAAFAKIARRAGEVHLEDGYPGQQVLAALISKAEALGA